MAGDYWRDGGWRKQLIDRHFLERREAEDLQNCVETGLEREAFSDDGDQDIGNEVAKLRCIRELLRIACGRTFRVGCAMAGAEESA